MDKNWFIQQYNDIHNNLFAMEKEIESHLKNKENLLGKEELIEDLKNKIHLEIERLNNTRRHEREIFNY